MGQALYRKYRSKNLAEVVGQEHITENISQAIKSGRISHAYLFTGLRGTGKTSVARILAHEINGLKYNHEDNHVDIIEIDAASNRGIDEIRDLREKVYSAPLSAKYKVYIIDEVHMLTTPAFNALLKTLEEPPAHVVFILATTEAHKLPQTIVSRTQRYIFRPIETEKVIGHLKYIAKQEKIQIDDEALELIAKNGGGSFRDSISLLDQASGSGKPINKAKAEELLGIPPDEQVAALLKDIQQGNISELLDRLSQLSSSGYHASAVAQKLASLLRAGLVQNQSQLPVEQQMTLLRALLDVAPAHEPSRMLEIVLLQALPIDNIASATITTESVPQPKVETVVSPVKPTPTPVPPTPVILPAVQTAQKEETELAKGSELLDAELWPKILNELKKTHNTLYGVMRMAVPEFEPGLLRLRFQFAFHQKRMNEAKHRAIVGQIIEKLSGQTIAIECVHDKDALIGGGPVGSTHPATDDTAPPLPPSSLTTISNIFGGGELLES